MAYAEDTNVSSDRSQQELQKTLRRYGAEQFMMGWNPEAAQVEFWASNRRVRFILPMPDRNAREFTHTPARKYRRTEPQIDEAYEQAIRQRWRALNLVVKAKLEAVAAGISTFESEFMAQTVLPNGMTAGEMLLPEIERTYEQHSVEPLFQGMKAISANS